MRRVLLLALGAAYSLALAGQFRFNNVDDAYIAFRYGRHMMEGHGLVFNPGERVEGYTSFLWTVLLAPWTQVGADIVWFSIGLGLLGSLVALLGLEAHVRLHVARGASPWLFAVLPLVALDNSYAFWAIGGMETLLFTALVLWSTYMARAREGGRPALVCGLLLGLATLARPEGALFFTLLAAHRALQRRPGARRELVLLAAGFALLVLPHLLWRRLYYDAWLPNTFHNKVSIGGSALAAGGAYLGQFVLWRYGAPLLGLLALADPAARRRLALPGALASAYLAYVVIIGGDWPIANRFIVPVIPFVHLLAAEGALAAGRLAWGAPAAARAPTVGHRALRASLLGALFLTTGLGSFMKAESYGMVRCNDNVVVETQRKRFGLWLRRNVGPGTLIAAGPAGAIPYYSRLPTVDMWGLTDRHIARARRSGFYPGHDRSDLAYVLDRRPALIIGEVGFDANHIPEDYVTVDDSIPIEDRPRDLVLGRVRQAH